MELYGFHRFGFDGAPVAVEVDVRPSGLPGIDLVGLPDGAVREARDRVRSGVRNSGYRIPKGRILLNLAPAGIKKEGAGFDLAIALALIGADRKWFKKEDGGSLRIMALGEVQLSGAVLGVRGVLSAAAVAESQGFDYLFVPEVNYQEAIALGSGRVVGISTIGQGVECLESIFSGEYTPQSLIIPEATVKLSGNQGDFSDVKGQSFLKRGLEIAAAGGHHSLVFGVPGCGKTMSALRLAGILPDLEREEAIELSKIHSIAGTLPEAGTLIRRPPTRSPHHSSSLQGILGGGPGLLPGEISLAHRGVLILDEAPEFQRHILQHLRDPLERGKVHIARAGRSTWFPARFQLVMTANPCPCGNLGRKRGVCVCSQDEIARYWRKIGGALLDRIDIRIPVQSDRQELVQGKSEESSSQIAQRVARANQFRKKRGQEIRNADLPPANLDACVVLCSEGRELLGDACEALDLSSRAIHSVLRVARSIADLKELPNPDTESLKEAILYRRYGDNNFLWAST